MDEAPARLQREVVEWTGQVDHATRGAHRQELRGGTERSEHTVAWHAHATVGWHKTRENKLQQERTGTEDGTCIDHEWSVCVHPSYKVRSREARIASDDVSYGACIPAPALVQCDPSCIGASNILRPSLDSSSNAALTSEIHSSNAWYHSSRTTTAIKQQHSSNTSRTLATRHPHCHPHTQLEAGKSPKVGTGRQHCVPQAVHERIPRPSP